MEHYRNEFARHFSLVLSLILAGLVVIFVVQNAAVVQVRFLFWSLLMSFSLFVFILFAVGVFAGWLMHSYSTHRRRIASGRG